MSLREMIRRNTASSLPLNGLQEEMNRLFERFYNGALVRMTNWDQQLPSCPPADISENAKSFKIKFELAGIDPEDVDLEIGEGFVAIRGEKEEQKEEKGENYLSQEIDYGSFYRSLPLPEIADTAKAEAKFKNGVLTVEVPKKASALQSAKKLQIKKAA